MKYLAFDLEIKEEIPEGCTDWRSVGPLGITCAATVRSDGDLIVWKPSIGKDGCYREQMTARRVDEMARYMYQQAMAGYTLITWNGLGFDFPVMVEEMHDERLKAEIAEMALFHHIDMAYQMRSEKGFMIGLNTCAQALGVEGKTEGMHGDLAPTMWKRERHEQDLVLEYVAQDVRVTAACYEAILDQKSFKWITKSGRLSRYPWAPKTAGDGARMLTCAEAARLPKADTSWMDRQPLTVELYYEWTGIDLGDLDDPGAITTEEERALYGGIGYRTPESEGAGPAVRHGVPEFAPDTATEPPPDFVEENDIPF